MGGLSSLWNLALLSLTARSRSPVKIYKVPSGCGLKQGAPPPPFITSPNSTPRDLNSHPPTLPGLSQERGARLLTVGVSWNTVLKRQRGLTAPAFSPAGWGLRVPRLGRPGKWPRSPLPGNAPSRRGSEGLCAAHPGDPHRAAGRSEGACRAPRLPPSRLHPAQAPPSPTRRRARRGSAALGPRWPGSRRRAFGARPRLPPGRVQSRGAAVPGLAAEGARSPQLLGLPGVAPGATAGPAAGFTQLGAPRYPYWEFGMHRTYTVTRMMA